MDFIVRGTFTKLGNYMCPLDGSIVINSDYEILSISAYDVDLSKLEDKVDFHFVAEDWTEYSQEDLKDGV